MSEKFTEVDETVVINHAVIRIRVCEVSGFLKDTGFLLCALSKTCFPMSKKKINRACKLSGLLASINTWHIFSQVAIPKHSY